jgi:hypothetical protein
VKSWFFEGMLTAAIALPALSGAAWAAGKDDFGCSNTTLKGEYAYAVTAYTPPGLPNGPPQVIAGIRVFDGTGNIPRDYYYIGDSLRTMGQTDFSTGGTETYTVNPNCTGSIVINQNVPGVPAGTSSGVLEIRFVISDGGRHIHEVVSEFTPPGFTEPQPTQTSADDWKVASEREN